MIRDDKNSAPLRVAGAGSFEISEIKRRLLDGNDK